MEHRVVGQLAVGPDPQALYGSRVLGCQGSSPMCRWSIGCGRSNQSTSSPSRARAAQEGGRGFGFGDLGHGELVVQALLVVVERDRHVEDGRPC